MVLAESMECCSSIFAKKSPSRRKNVESLNSQPLRCRFLNYTCNDKHKRKNMFAVIRAVHKAQSTGQYFVYGLRRSDDIDRTKGNVRRSSCNILEAKHGTVLSARPMQRDNEDCKES